LIRDNVKIAGSFASIVVFVLVRLTEGASLKAFSDIGVGVSSGGGVTTGVDVGVGVGVGVGDGVVVGGGEGVGVGVDGVVTVNVALTPSAVTLYVPAVSFAMVYSTISVAFAATVTLTVFTSSSFILNTIGTVSLVPPAFSTVAVIVTFSPTSTLSGDTVTLVTVISASDADAVALMLKTSAAVAKITKNLKGNFLIFFFFTSFLFFQNISPFTLLLGIYLYVNCGINNYRKMKNKK
jgi:hypothetical protein